MIPHTLHDLSFVERFYTFTAIDSTNIFAKNLSVFPRSGIFVIQSDRQHKGKGRQGNTFFSDVKGGLWVSLVVPVDDIGTHFTNNRALSIAICDSLRQFFPEAPVKIKWPNDIYWNVKKICGILLENIPGRNDMLIIGFGLNVNLKDLDFPSDLLPIATSYRIETGRIISLGDLLRCILLRFRSNQEQPAQAVHEKYTGLLYMKGEPADIDGEKGIFRTVGIDGSLQLETPEGIKHIRSGTLRFTGRNA